MAQQKLSGRDYDFRESTLRQEQTERSEDFSGELQGEPGGFQPTESTDDAEARADFGRFKVTSSVVITMNLELNSTCRRKTHSLFN